MDGLELLLHGIDTLECAYYFAGSGKGIDFEELATRRETLKHSRRQDPEPIQLGDREFLLYPNGTKSGYPFLVTNEDFKIQFGPYNRPNFFVTFRSEALWREPVEALHAKFLSWAQSLGFQPYRKEGLSRVDFCFDYHLPAVDFDEQSFVSLSAKDSQHRRDGKIQTFTFGKGDVVLRVYDKVAEIEEKSQKTWFFDLWGQAADVWRIEWQVRKPVLRRFDICTFEDLEANRWDLLLYLAKEHDTLRVSSEDSNRSRRPLHPLWQDLLRRIEAKPKTGIAGVGGENSTVEQQLLRIGIQQYGYLKRIAALHCVRWRKDMVQPEDALAEVGRFVDKLHDPITWEADVRKRVAEIRLGRC